ncbi:MAG: MarC family protein, partial [Candidatus Nanopelagicales bacterium]|nr:MarC family protein [Candidatus Nanopelagicales bacterium]
FSPMAMPILSGPGAMGIIIGLEAQSQSPLDSIGLALGSLGIAALVAVCLLAANPLNRTISPSAMIAMTRIFGFILLAIAVAVFASGISSLFGIPLHGSPPG